MYLKMVDIRDEPIFFVCAQGKPKKEVFTFLPLNPIDSQKVSTPRRLRYQSQSWRVYDNEDLRINHTIVYTNIAGKRFRGMRENIREKILVSFGYTFRRMMRVLRCDTIEDVEQKYDCQLINLKDVYKKRYHLLGEERISRMQMTIESGLDIRETEPNYPKGKGYHICHTYKSIYQKINGIEPLSKEMAELWKIALSYMPLSNKKVVPVPDENEIDIEWQRVGYLPKLGVTLEIDCFRRTTYPDSGVVNTPNDIHVESFPWKDLREEKKMALLMEKCDHIFWS